MIPVVLVASPARGADAPDSTADPWSDVISPDRPGAANPTTVLRPREFQLEFAFETSITRPTGLASIRTYDFPTLLRYGVSRRFELRLESTALNLTRDAGPGAPSSGLADVIVEAKGLLHEGGGGIVPSFAVLPAVSLPTGASGFSAGRVQMTLSALCDWPLRSGPTLSLNGDVYRVVNDSGDRYEWQASSEGAIGIPLGRRWAISGDVFVTAPLVSGVVASWFADAAVEYFPDPDTQLDLGGILPTGGPANVTSLQFGLSRRWGPGRGTRRAAPGASPVRTTSPRP